MTRSEVSLRRAVAAEAAALTELSHEAKGHWGYTGEQLAAWRDELTISSESIAARPTFVAELDGALAGCLQLDPTIEPWALEHLWVRPSAMGRGVGSALVERALATARERGQSVLAIDADPHAERFYRARGARRVGALPAPLPGDPERVRPQLVLDVAPTDCRE